MQFDINMMVFCCCVFILLIN